MNKTIFIVLIKIILILIESSSTSTIITNHDFSGYFFYKTIINDLNGNKYIEFKKNSFYKIKFQFSIDSISLPKGMDFQFLYDNEKTSMVKARIINCNIGGDEILNDLDIDDDEITCKNIEIFEIYQPIPYYNSNEIIEKELDQSSNSLEFLKFKLNENEKGSNVKKFTNLKTNEKYSIDYNSIRSPYKSLPGFDNKWYDSDIGLNNTILILHLQSKGSYNEPNKYNNIYYNQNVLLIYSKVEWCLSKFPEPTDYDPYFTVRRNRLDNKTKCSPPTGVVIGIDCKYVPVPICSNGLSLISFNDPRYYCPMYTCDLPIHYYS